MPRAATPNSRSRRAARQTRSTPSKRPAAIASSTPSEGERMKGEPKDAALVDSQQTTASSSRTKPPPVLLNRRRPWKHPDELEYITPEGWDEDQIIGFLCKNGFSMPPRLSHTQSPWCEVTDRNGDVTVIPRGYRLPLMFAAKFQWESLRLVMTSAKRNEEWDDYKFDILHVSRLCSEFLEKARASMGAAGMERSWRCPMFDRALTRYYRRWLVNREEYVKAFWLEYKEEEYERDILKGDWIRFVQKGHKGFNLTRDEINNGITFDEFTHGLSFIGGRLNWESNHNSVGLPNLSHAAEPAADEAEGPELPSPPLETENVHKDPITDKIDTCLSPTALTIKLEQIVDDPDFFRLGLSKDHPVIHIDTTPEYGESPSYVTANHADYTITGKPMDTEPICTRTLNPDDLYVPVVSTKAVEPITTIDKFVDEAVAHDPDMGGPGHGAATVTRQLDLNVDSASSVEVTIPEVDPVSIAEVGRAVGVGDPPVTTSQDIEMESADEESSEDEEPSEDGKMDQGGDSRSSPADRDSATPIRGSSPEIPPLPFSPDDSTPTHLDQFGTGILPVHMINAEPLPSDPTPPPDVEMSFQPSHHLPRLESHQPPSRDIEDPNEQPPPSEKTMSPWNVPAHATTQQVKQLSESIQPPTGDQGVEVEGSTEPSSRHLSIEVESAVNGDCVQGPIELPRRVTPIAQPSTPPSVVVPALGPTAITPENMTDARSGVAAGKARQADPQPLAEGAQQEGREDQKSVEPVLSSRPMREPDPQEPMDMDISDAEPMSISQAPRAKSRRPEPFGHVFIDPNVRNMSLSSVSSYRRQSLSEEDLQSQSSRDSSPVVRQVMSMFRETLSGVLDSLERGTAISPRALSQQFISAVPMSASTSLSSIPDSSVAGELLDEIRSLRQQIQEDADRRLDRDLEVQRLQSQVDDLRRHVRMMDSQSRMSVDVEDENKVPESPSTSSSTFSPHVRRRPVDPDPSPVISSHPLAHLLAMDLDEPTSTESRAETTTTNGSPWSTPDISTPVPCPEPSAPHDTAPLPIKSQRKHRMMFFPQPKQP